MSVADLIVIAVSILGPVVLIATLHRLDREALARKPKLMAVSDRTLDHAGRCEAYRR